MKIKDLSDWIVKYGVGDNRKEHDRLCYEKNRKALLSYPFRRIDLPTFEHLDIEPIQLNKGMYSYHNRKDRRFGETFKIMRTDRVEHPFFQSLDKPLLVKNEMNTYHWEYLYDNVRRSEDWGGDNHIYMYYESSEVFFLLLQIEDITDFLSMEKFVFLFGEEELRQHYPLNFAELGIDYRGMECQYIRVDEVQRIFANLAYFSDVGNDFFYGVTDGHKNLLTMGQRGLPDYCFAYDVYLEGKTVDEFEADYKSKGMDPLVYKEFSIMLGDTAPSSTQMEDRPDPDKDLFFQWLHILWEKDDVPDRVEWIKLLFLSYSYALGRKFFSRITPAIMFNTHFNVKIMPKEEGTRHKRNFEFFTQFKYCSMILPVRRPIVATAAINYWHHKAGHFPDRSFVRSFFQTYLPGRTNGMFDIRGGSKLKFVKIVRFEDMKLHSIAMLTSLCEYLDIEWDEILLRVTYNGKDTVFDLTAGYDPTPVYKRYFDMCNPFDYYRIELVLSKYWRHFGYEPLFFKDNISYTREEIHKMFDLPFQFEKHNMTEKAWDANVIARKRMHDQIDKWLDEGDLPHDKDGNELIPIPWLKPKHELLEGDLYR